MGYGQWRSVLFQPPIRWPGSRHGFLLPPFRYSLVHNEQPGRRETQNWNRQLPSRPTESESGPVRSLASSLLRLGFLTQSTLQNNSTWRQHAARHFSTLSSDPIFITTYILTTQSTLAYFFCCYINSRASSTLLRSIDFDRSELYIATVPTLFRLLRNSSPTSHRSLLQARTITSCLPTTAPHPSSLPV